MATTTGAITARNVLVKVGGQDVSGSSNMVTVEPAKEVADFAVFGDDWQHNVSSIKSWAGSIRAVYSEESNEGLEEIWTAYASMDEVAFYVCPRGTASTYWTWTGSVHFTGAPVTLDRTGGVVTIEAPFVGNGTLTKGSVGT